MLRDFTYYVPQALNCRSCITTLMTNWSLRWWLFVLPLNLVQPTAWAQNQTASGGDGLKGDYYDGVDFDQLFRAAATPPLPSTGLTSPPCVG